VTTHVKSNQHDPCSFLQCVHQTPCASLVRSRRRRKQHPSLSNASSATFAKPRLVVAKKKEKCLTTAHAPDVTFVRRHLMQTGILIFSGEHYSLKELGSDWFDIKMCRAKILANQFGLPKFWHGTFWPQTNHSLVK